jgi:hypothetical protein
MGVVVVAGFCAVMLIWQRDMVRGDGHHHWRTVDLPGCPLRTTHPARRRLCHLMAAIYYGCPM